MGHYVTVLHECKDYSNWKQAFDADLSHREAAVVLVAATLAFERFKARPGHCGNFPAPLIR
jgi:hypothetical protein